MTTTSGTRSKKSKTPGALRRRGLTRGEPGSDLLWHARRAHYHRRRAFSLPSSEWDRVVPARYGRQASCLRLTEPVSRLRAPPIRFVSFRRLSRSR